MTQKESPSHVEVLKEEFLKIQPCFLALFLPSEERGQKTWLLF
jgi:hypothetical protein